MRQILERMQKENLLSNGMDQNFFSNIPNDSKVNARKYIDMAVREEKQLLLAWQEEANRSGGEFEEDELFERSSEKISTLIGTRSFVGCVISYLSGDLEGSQAYFTYMIKEDLPVVKTLHEELRQFLFLEIYPFLIIKRPILAKFQKITEEILRDEGIKCIHRLQIDCVMLFNGLKEISEESILALQEDFKRCNNIAGNNIYFLNAIPHYIKSYIMLAKIFKEDCVFEKEYGVLSNWKGIIENQNGEKGRLFSSPVAYAFHQGFSENERKEIIQSYRRLGDVCVLTMRYPEAQVIYEDLKRCKDVEKSDVMRKFQENKDRNPLLVKKSSPDLHFHHGGNQALRKQLEKYHEMALGQPVIIGLDVEKFQYAYKIESSEDLNKHIKLFLQRKLVDKFSFADVLFSDETGKRQLLLIEPKIDQLKLGNIFFGIEIIPLEKTKIIVNLHYLVKAELDALSVAALARILLEHNLERYHDNLTVVAGQLKMEIDTILRDISIRSEKGKSVSPSASYSTERTRKKQRTSDPIFSRKEENNEQKNSEQFWDDTIS